MPLGVHIKERPAYFHRFDALWTPTVLVLDSEGKERWRIEGYLSNREFRAQLEAALARSAFMHKRFDEAERLYAGVLERHPDTDIAAEALYWSGVSHYKATNDHTGLGPLAQTLRDRYPDSLWTEKASVWLG